MDWIGTWPGKAQNGLPFPEIGVAFPEMNTIETDTDNTMIINN